MFIIEPFKDSMKTLFKLCWSIIKRNKGFTIGLFIMSILSVTLAFLGVNFGKSSSETVTDYLTKSGMPDVVYSTEITLSEIKEDIQAIEGVDCVSARFIYDLRIKDKNDGLYSVKFFAWNNDSPFSHTFIEHVAVNENETGVFLSSDFAKSNGIKVGDDLVLKTPVKNVDVKVEAIISNPETMNCKKDEMSDYESSSFGYLYLRYEDFTKVTEISNLYNQFLVYFSEGLTSIEKQSAMNEIKSVIGEDFISETFVENSNEIKEIFNDLGSIGVLCSFIPSVIWAISLGFGFIFIKIIVQNQKKTIGLLRALGYKISKIVFVFVFYTLLINFFATVLGLPLGYLLLRFCLNTLAKAEGITETVVCISYLMTLLSVLIVFAIGVASSLMSSKAISKIDPSEAYGGQAEGTVNPPAFVSKIKADGFIKISIASIIRKYKRQIIGALCITACIISMCMGFEGVLTIGNPIDAVYGGRFRYDLMVRDINSTDYQNITDNVNGIEFGESYTLFASEFSNDTVRVSTVNENSELLVLVNANGETITPKDGVIIDEMCAKINGIKIGDTIELEGLLLKVTGIAREILFNFFYVSPKTAKEMGHGDINCIMLKLKEGVSEKDVKREIYDICSGAYAVEFSLQKEEIRNGFTAMRTIMFVFAVIGFGIGSLLILNISIIDFYENKAKYATLRSIGVPIKKLSIVSGIENLSLVIIGVILACPLCKLGVTVLLRLLSNASQQYVMVSYTECFILSCVISLIYIFMGIGITLKKIKNMNLIENLNGAE